MFGLPEWPGEIEVTMEHPPITDTSMKTWVILGSKRGGTSFLAQILGENGVSFAHCGNGHNEDLDFVKFNDKVLTEAGGDWNDLPSDTNIAAAVENHKDELVDLLKRKRIRAKHTGAFGWKDPRQGATIKHFFPYLEDDVYMVVVLRRPDKAAASMHRTWPQHSLSYCKIVIGDYYERILSAFEAFVDYDWSDNET